MSEIDQIKDNFEFRDQTNKRLCELRMKLDELEKLGDAWAQLFKRLNADRMEDNHKLMNRLYRLEKTLAEPLAEKIMKGAQKSLIAQCPHCKRLME